MAEFRCRTCRKEGTWIYDPDRFSCPLCDSIDVQFVVRRHELPDDEPAAKRMDELSAEETKKKDSGA